MHPLSGALLFFGRGLETAKTGSTNFGGKLCSSDLKFCAGLRLLEKTKLQNLSCKADEWQIKSAFHAAEGRNEL
jgi:hypothetical protein